jgi:VWFA-related protein
MIMIAQHDTMRLRLLTLLVLVCCLCGLNARAGGQEPTFTAANRTVAVYTTVTDVAGRLVTDLGREVFQVDDSGKRQELTFFANDLQPITIVVLLDRSGSMRSNFTLVERAAEQFVTTMGPGDKARIGSFADRIQLDPRDFTSDQGELIQILRTDLQNEGPTPLWNAVNVGITALLHQQGRRVILVFTDGVDSPMDERVSISLKEVMKRAEQENVMVYAIGLTGTNVAPRRGFGGPLGGRRRGGYGGFGGFGVGRRFEDNKPDEGLPKIAAATGGGYFELTRADDLGATFTRVADELHHQYVLGFTPASLDGKMHTLEVRIAQLGMTARARKSYLARK